MMRSTARWTTAFAAAALLALPATGLAQGSAAQPPAQPPTSPPATTGATDPAAQPPAPAAQPNEQAAKQHLTAARNTLSEMTQLPAASQLTGDARTHVSQLITNFNELITTPMAWRASYAKVEANLNALLGSATADESAARTTGTEGAVGTSGTVAVDPAIKAKLIEFRDHLDKFEKAAGGSSASSEAASSAAAATPPAAGTTPPATSTPAGATPPQQPPSERPTAGHGSTMDHQELLRHVQAIEVILNVQAPAATGTSGTTGTEPAATQSNVTLTPAQLDQLRTHLSELKRLLGQK
jgi:hypothetical protein